MNEDQNPKPNKDSSKHPLATPPANIQEILRKGIEIYDALKEQLENSYSGKYVVIEVSSGKYFIGETRDEATVNARKEFPDQIMFVRRVGQVEKASRHSSQYRLKHARVF